jgi:hypothetical protein
MERDYAAIGLAAGALLFLGCGGGKSPVQTTAPSDVAAPKAFSLSGHVSDTAYRPVSGSRVEVRDGPRAGTVATTDESGGFSMPGTFTGTITVTVSKDGYLANTSTIPFPGFEPPSVQSKHEVYVYLELLGPSLNLAGVFSLTLTADAACTDLPDVTRTRTYTATIAPVPSSTTFLASLSDTRFFSTYNSFGVYTAGDFALAGIWRTDRGQSSSTAGIVEQLRETTYVAIEGSGSGSFGASGFTVPFHGAFEYCPSEPVLISDLYSCPATARVRCQSDNHQLTLARR